MKVLIIAVLGLLAVANAGPVTRKTSRLPLPLALQEKYGYIMEDDLPEVLEKLNRVVGGTEVPEGGRPYQIALERSNSFTCGGSFISSRTVLTAAHCVQGAPASSLTVRYDTLVRTSGPTLTVSSVNVHPEYSSSTIDNDVATLILTAAFTPGSNAAISTLAAAGSDPSHGIEVIVSGWGRIVAGGALATNLLQASLAVVDRDQCNSIWGSTAVTPRMVCAHDATGSACNGDSGGPLTQDATQVGVVSWGSSSCLHATLPNVYASVGNLRPWIDLNTIQ